jgi:hypothetical protein
MPQFRMTCALERRAGGQLPVDDYRRELRRGRAGVTVAPRRAPVSSLSRSIGVFAQRLGAAAPQHHVPAAQPSYCALPHLPPTIRQILDEDTHFWVYFSSCMLIIDIIWVLRYAQIAGWHDEDVRL